MITNSINLSNFPINIFRAIPKGSNVIDPGWSEAEPGVEFPLKNTTL